MTTPKTYEESFEAWCFKEGMTPAFGPIPSICRKAFEAGRKAGVEEAGEAVKFGLENNKRLFKASLSRDQKIAFEGGIGACEGILDLLADLTQTPKQEGE